VVVVDGAAALVVDGATSSRPGRGRDLAAVADSWPPGIATLSPDGATTKPPTR